jgi:LPS sulfotransferase NodH
MLGPEVMAELRLRNAQGDRQLFVIADPADEGARLAQLSRTFPALRFCGLGRDLWPALTARADAAVFGDIPATLALRTITLVFATPRSGSSLLADLLTDIGAGKVLEHLRDDTVGVLTSGYVFDRRAALRNFLNLAATKGSFGTKFISHFLHDALTRTDLLADLAEVTAGVELRVLLLDRRDKVAQALSGYVAWQRGLWHVTNPAEADRLRALPAPALRFPEALAWYLDYLQQSRFVDLFRPVFPQAMALVYEDDLLGQDLAALAQRLAAFLGLPPPHGPFRKAAARLRLADGGTALMAEDFTRQFRQTFAAPP